MTTLEDVWEVESCAWLVPTAPAWRSVRPCGKPSSRTVTDGRLTAQVCARHGELAVGHGWSEVAS